MSGPTYTRVQKLGLYRAILRAHRAFLGEYEGQRALGDRYVKEEFHRHRNADAKFVAPFLRAWEEYLQVLLERRKHAGAHLEPAQMAALNESQRLQVERLKKIIDGTEATP
ncbi:Succinate dehydrogenase assembly factor 3, mitochondrial [Porphyridium purpureum]|uniref:Succinate dehydrogenase assembly factor 3 n=1 Tax=Porphyridium purpureum TaxID=35688 RepID=A0A5J4Z559_PORPP|nr:Succinate dehydrogenase assembly factor 3, mitochondrial [Porphyridium purpureum]|eukprot:POR9828..scf295_1